MELYEILDTIYADSIEDNDFIEFEWEDEDNVKYTDRVRVKTADFEGRYIIVKGFSEVLNQTDTYRLPDNTQVNVLGG
jgi:hypothetical protein